MKTLLVDVDSVLRDMTISTVKMYNKRHHQYMKKEDVKVWGLKESLPLMRSDLEYYVQFPKDILVNAPEENPANIPLLNKWYNENRFKVHIVTHQLRGFEKYTLEWLENHNVYYHYITFARDKEVVKGDILVDDRVDNLLAKKKADHKTLVIAYNQPWNMQYKGPKVNDFVELEKLILR